MYIFLSGVVTMGFLMASLFFLKFWRRTHDQLFLWFGVSFVLLALSQALVALTDIPTEEKSSIYLLRVTAFAIIIAAILWKNVRAQRS